MKIAITDIYGKLYEQDRLFDLSTCKIGENLLLPVIELKKDLEKEGHEYHTIDMYSWHEIDKVIFQEIPDSIYTVTTAIQRGQYLLKCILQKDKLYRATKTLQKKDRILLMLEPPVVALKSYKKEYHKYFGKILTWNDDLVDGKKYFKIYYPQPVPKEKYFEEFSKKNDFVMICGNKCSAHPDELYSERKKVIDFFEKTEDDFSLYGFGWQTENYRNYKGTVDKKLQTLSKYKYAICFENQHNINGYITEKIFDCFFANCVPIYWGASNITQYIPENTFIDWRKFSSIKEMLTYVNGLDENAYYRYLENISAFLNSEKFNECFSVQAYIKNMKKMILDS